MAAFSQFSPKAARPFSFPFRPFRGGDTLRRNRRRFARLPILLYMFVAMYRYDTLVDGCQIERST